MSHTLFAVKLPWWPTGHILVQQLQPSGEDKEVLCKQQTLLKNLPPHRCWIWSTGTEMAQPNYFGSHSCSVDPVSHLPALLWPLCYCRPGMVSVRAMKTSHSSKKHHPRELCGGKTKGSSCLTARTSHHVINIWWQEKHHQESLFSPAQGQGCTLHQGCAEPAGGSIQFPDPFLACP